MEVHRTTGITSSSLTQICEPRGSLKMTGCSGFSEEYDRFTPSVVETKSRERLFDRLHRAETKYNQAGRTYKNNFDRRGQAVQDV